MNPDAVYTMLVEANPVPDPDTALPMTPELERLHRPDIGSETMTLTIQRTDESPSPTPRRHRWILAAAAAAIVLLGIAALAVTRDDPDPEPVDQPVPTVAPTPSPEDAAVITAQTYLTALYAGDADTAIAMTDPDLSNIEADRNMTEMLGTAYTVGNRPTVGTCTAADTGTWIDVRCEVTQHDPVYVELGVADLVAPIRVYEDGSIDWLPWEGGDFTQANWAYSDYLRLHHTAEYEAVCLPGSYEVGTVNSNANMALTAACAELWAPLADEVAQWIRDGRPEPVG